MVSIKRIKPNILLILLVIHGLNAGGQLAADFLHFKKYSGEEGLRSNYSKKIVEDPYGFMWIATQDGLCRFDGKTFIQFNKNTASKIAGNDVTDIVIDKDANLIWASTALGGINAIDLKTLKVKKEFLITRPGSEELNDWIVSMLLVKNELWIGTNNGLFVYNTGTNSLTGKLETPGMLNGTREFRYQKLISQDQTTIVTLINNNIIAVYGIRDKKIISGINLSGNNTKSILYISDITIADGKNILAATSAGIRRFQVLTSSFDKELKFTDAPAYDFIKIPDIRLISKESEDILWLATNTGLYKATISNKRINRVVASTKFQNFDWESSINQIYFDSNKHLWISGTPGILASNNSPSPFTSYTALNNEILKIGHTYSIFKDDHSNYLINTSTGLIISDSGLSSGEKINPNSSFYSATIINGRQLIFSSNGIQVLNNKILNSPVSFFPELRPIEFEEIGTWLKAGDSVLLLASYLNKGIWKWNYKSKELTYISTQKKNDSVKTQQINSLYPDPSGAILIVCLSNIYKYSLENNSLTEIPVKTPANCIFYDVIKKGAYYFVGTYGDGVLVFDNQFNFVTQLKTQNGLSNNNIYNFYNLNDSSILASTNFGASIIHAKDLSVRSYYAGDGLASNSLEYNFHTYSNETSFFLPSLNGFSIVTPAFLSRNTIQPKVYFDKISVETASGTTDTIDLEIEKIRVPNNFHRVIIFFAGLNFSNSDRISYAYRIQKITDNWINSDGKNFISLISMSPGTYTLQLKAINEDGVESNIKELILVFLPKWYQTWWFKTLLVLSILTISYALYRMRINQFKKEQQIRTKIASDLHDDLGSTMNSVKVYANLAIMEKQADKYLPLIKDGTQDAITGIRDIIWVLDDSKDSIEHLLTRINSFASPLCEANSIRYKQELSDNARDHKLGQEERRNLYMMLKEAVNNSVKYSGGDTIEIEVSLLKGKPVIRVIDNGKGFDTAKNSEGNGLKNMQRRAKEIKYRIQIDSAPGKGTTLLFAKA